MDTKLSCYSKTISGSQWLRLLTGNPAIPISLIHLTGHPCELTLTCSGNDNLRATLLVNEHGLVHSYNNDPAIRLYHRDLIEFEMYTKNGAGHRLDGPARIMYIGRRTCICEKELAQAPRVIKQQWMVNGVYTASLRLFKHEVAKLGDDDRETGFASILKHNIGDDNTLF